MSDVVGRKTIDDLEPVVIPESLATIRVPANVDGQTVRLTVQQLSDAIKTDATNKINLNGDNAILDNLSQEAKDNIALNLSADFNSTPTTIARNVVFEATTNGWLHCYLATLSEYVPVVSRSDDASFTNSTTIASNGIPGTDSSGATFLVFIPKGKFIKWTGGLNLTVIKFYKCAGK